MTLDDVYGPEHDRFPLEQERTPPTRPLEWGDAMERAKPDRAKLLDGARPHARPSPGMSRDDALVHAPLPVLLQIARRFA